MTSTMHTAEMSLVQQRTKKLQKIIAGTSLDNEKLQIALKHEVYDSNSRKVTLLNTLTNAPESSRGSSKSTSIRSSLDSSIVSNLSFPDVKVRIRPLRDRVLVIFIRHFLCGNCQEYLLRLSCHPNFSKTNLSKHNVRIVIIGCGSPSYIATYRALTRLPDDWMLYADPSTELYSTLGMQRSLKMGDRRPVYIQRTFTGNMLRSVLQGVRRVPQGDAGKAGSWDVNGGEYLIEVSRDIMEVCQLKWSHQMENSRDHTEVDDLIGVVGLGATSMAPTNAFHSTDTPKLHSRTFSTPVVLGLEHEPNDKPKAHVPMKRQFSLRQTFSPRRQSWLERSSRSSTDIKNTTLSTKPAH